MLATSITRFFPVPTFLKIPTVGFDISTDAIKIAEIIEKRHSYAIGKFAEVPLPPGVIQNGKIENKDTLLAVLTDTRKKYGLKYISASLPEEKSYIFNLRVPYAKPKELRDIVELQLEEHVPLSGGDIIFDYHAVRYYQGTDEIELNVAVLPKEVVETYLSLLEGAGLSPLVFEAEAQAIARAVVPHKDLGTHMVVDFGNTRTIFCIVSGGEVLFNTVHGFGSSDITKAIAKDRSISFEEAETLKRKEGILEKQGNGDIFPSAISVLSVLKDEIGKFIGYWDNKEKKEVGGGTIEKVFFCGGGAAMKGFSEFFSGYIAVSLTLANVWVNVFDLKDKVPLVHRDESLKFATVIGLGLLNYRNRL